MRASAKRSLRHLVPAIAVVATLAWASGFDEKGPEGPDIANFDKIAHFFVFGLLATLWFRWLPGGLKGNFRLLGALALTMMYGVVDEWIQASNPVRSSDAWDWVADGLGALTALFVYRGWTWYRRLLESPIGDLFKGRMIDDEGSL